VRWQVLFLRVSSRSSLKVFGKMEKPKPVSQAGFDECMDTQA
jgi:hypothetical protein